MWKEIVVVKMFLLWGWSSGSVLLQFFVYGIGTVLVFWLFRDVEWMGDRIYIKNLKCAYCKATQEEVYYAESCGFVTHKCERCSKENNIVMDFFLTRMEKWNKMVKRYLCNICSVLSNKRVYHNTLKEIKAKQEYSDFVKGLGEL